MPHDQLLIVDDEPNVRSSLQEYFERERFWVSVAADGPSAVALLDRARIGATESGGWYQVDDRLRLHLERHLVEAAGQGVTLTEQEFSVLTYLVKHYGEPVTRTDLIEAVWQYEEGVSDAAVNTCIARLRKKIEPDPAHLHYIHTLASGAYDQTRLWGIEE